MASSSYSPPAGEPMPEEEVDFRERLEQVAEEKRRALAEPGPGWKEWFFHDGAKWWMGLLFLILDSWIIAGGLESGLLLPAVAALVPATYLQFLLWRFLWFRPTEDLPLRAVFHRTWTRPVEYGRWTPEAVIVRTEGRAALGGGGPSPKDFL